MAIKCRLDRNISLNQIGDSGDSCNSTDISAGVGGIQSPVLIYNIDDIESLTYKDDARADDSLIVETINSTGQFYKVDFSSATYNEEYDSDKWTHTLTLDVANINPLFEDILADSVNGRYLVCFKPKGADDYRMFGVKFGATLDYSLNIAEDSFGYTIVFEDVSEYPLMTVYADNFGSKDKVYTPIFKVLYEAYFCEQRDGKNDGYAVAMYAVKVNSAGQPLDSDNKLCQWTGNKQDAYKHQNITNDGGYNILGNFNSSSTFEGKPVRVLDLEKCPSEIDGSIFVNGSKSAKVCINPNATTKTITVSSTNPWSMVTQPRLVSITPTEGLSGSTSCIVMQTAAGGVDHIQFQNNYTKEVVDLEVEVDNIQVNSKYTFPNGTTSFMITPAVFGCSSAYTYSISPSMSITKQSNGYLLCQPTASDSEQNFTLTITHSCICDEEQVEKEVKIKILGNNTDPSWQILSSFCEII